MDNTEDIMEYFFGDPEWVDLVETKDGHVYGFRALGTSMNGRIAVKFGWTNDWEYKKGCWYDDGLNQPKHIFLLKKVDDMRSTEKKLIEFAKESPYFSETPSFGKGWFETDLSDSVLESLFNYLLE